MGDIKNVIGYFCKYINCIFDWNTEDLLKPEYLRLAKHNKTDYDIVHKLWKILSHLEYPKLNHINGLTLIESVKLNFAINNYKCVEFYALPEDYSTSSRELLIALAWLISNTNILSKLVERKLSNYSIHFEFPEKNIPKDIEQKVNLSNDMDAMRYISLLMGKINNNLRVISDCDRKTIHNMKKIHGATKYDIDIPHLSIHDISLNELPDKQKQFLIDNQDAINLLEIRNKWEECQGSFWKWMNTVLDEKVNDEVSHSLKIHHNEELLNFIKILKLEVHKPQPLMVKKENHLINTCLSNFHSLHIQRHVYTPKKSTKETIITPRSQEQQDILSYLMSQKRNLDKSVEENYQSLSRISLQLTGRLKTVLFENNMKII